MSLHLPYLLETYSPAMEKLVLETVWSFAPDADICNMIQQIVKEKGKRIRPALVLGTHLGFGGDGMTAVPLACAVELIHNASLIHDDIEDMDAFRRNHPSAWKRFGVPQALNIGDFLLPCALHLVLGTRVSDEILRRLQKRLCKELMCLVHAQMLEIQDMDMRDLDMKTYHRICIGKTGTLFRLCLTGGAELLGDETEPFLEDLDQLGSSLGLLFQMRDDWIDITGKKEGRHALGDLLEGKISLVSVLARDLDPEPRNRFFDWFSSPRQQKTESEALKIREMLVAGGVLVRARELLIEQISHFESLASGVTPAGLGECLHDLLHRLFPAGFLEMPRIP